MFRLSILGIAAVLTLSPLTEAQAQSRDRFERREAPAAQERRVELQEIVRRVSAGRSGRMLGVRPSGSDYVLRWEYPGGRIADIYVDGRSGRERGER